MLLKDFIRHTCESLEAEYPPAEARSIVSLYCREVLGVQSYTHIVEPDFRIPEDRLAGMLSDAEKLAQGCPVQQVLGYAWFCGRKFRVTPDVLIPRPETEMLVERALSGLSRKERVLDLCTGSGCIAWSVLPQCSQVFAVDISRDALEVAESQSLDATSGYGAASGYNAAYGYKASSGAPIFLQADILRPQWWKNTALDEGGFDLLLSNPPYIKESEKRAMQRNVLEHEPEIALFVPDTDPLLFYRAIASAASSLLKPGGRAIVEINEALGEETAALFSAGGFSDVRIIDDLFGKPRFVEFFKAPPVSY